MGNRGPDSGEHTVRLDFVPKDSYLSKQFLERENERLWPHVWQVACRLEEIPNVGDYVTFDVAGESIIVVRTAADRIRAFFNVCQHRGRRLTNGSGKASKFHCAYHGWQWNLDGSVARVLDRNDWAGCEEMTDGDLRLTDVLVDTWGGFVFINMDPNAEPLAKFLDPVPEITNCFEFEKMRYRWYKSIRLPCNWKVALEAFNEGYHVAATHPQLLDVAGDDVTRSFAYGRHGMFGYSTATRMIGAPSPRTGKPMPEDVRQGLVNFFRVMEETLKAINTARDYEAAKRLMTEMSPSGNQFEVLAKAMDFQREAAIAEGAGWPEITFEQLGRAGADWHVFPNLVFLPYPDGALFYRARPDGDNPDSCIYDIWSLQRFAPGAEPPLKREFYYGVDDWRENAQENFGLILWQDFQNMTNVQQGMKSRGFKGSRTNPLQETSVSNFHRALREFIAREE
ncbi:aromatic ring-hydroxylating oxygenase subunit alpha [Paraburkholderia youngii]|uniref:Phenylpropionate dioxygenase-like ring-hydroxylating dioxygenase large terminal subunit n=1 Tax=Paraburkholderia youngii TaxID=2782701 RepID=A0A7W8LDK3_9BURK|nr:aromatic ring-hydroxylating dioxygenase subunit alpha [Paraburkholderia youngii]MBB5403751.1 phenylpropionate dioxygenase-like ring-hydroxylating dioxygenase large terminal subunit [Paraburkholderia youngii]